MAVVAVPRLGHLDLYALRVSLQGRETGMAMRGRSSRGKRCRQTLLPRPPNCCYYYVIAVSFMTWAYPVPDLSFVILSKDSSDLSVDGPSNSQ